MIKTILSVIFVLTAQSAFAQVVVVDCGGATGIHGVSSVLRDDPSAGFEQFLGKEVIPSLILDDNLRPALALRSAGGAWNVIERRNYDSDQTGSVLTFLIRDNSTSGTMQYNVATKQFFHAAADINKGVLFARYAQCE